MVSTDKVMLAAAGKAVQRGLVPSWPPEDGLLRIQVPQSLQDKNHLHRQAIRKVVEGINPEARLHITTTSDGLLVEYTEDAESEQDAAERIIEVLQTMIADMQRATQESERVG